MIPARTERAGSKHNSFFHRFRLPAVLLVLIVVSGDISLGIMSYEYFPGGTLEVLPENLIPHNIQALLHVNVDNTSLLIYEKNYSIGGVLPFSLATIFLDRGKSIQKLNSTNIEISRYGAFMSTSIYEIRGISLSSASRNLLGIVGAFNDSSLNTTTGFISDGIGGNTVAGNLNAVKYSIAAEHFNREPSNALKYLNMTAQSSLVYFENSTLISFVTVNSSSNQTVMKITFTSPTAENNFLEAYSLLVYDFVIFPIPLKIVGPLQLTMNLQMNMYQFIHFIASYWKILNNYAGGRT